MNRKKIVTTLFVTTLLTLSLTSCKKEVTQPNGKTGTKPAPSQPASPEKAPTHTEGIISNQGYPAADQLLMAYYSFWGQTQGQTTYQTNYLYHPTLNGSIVGCGAGLGKIVYAYKSDGATYMMYNGGEIPLFINNGATLFNYAIEEIEVHPVTGDVYALTRVGNGMKIYRFDTNGYGELMLCNSNNVVFNGTTYNGYKSGSIAFVPNGDGTYRLVFTHESNVYASSGIVCWHLEISGNTLLPMTAQSHTYNNPELLGSTAGINTTYGNGYLYFARDAGTLYALDVNMSNSIVPTGIPVVHKNDFGYYRN